MPCCTQPLGCKGAPRTSFCNNNIHEEEITANNTDELYGDFEGSPGTVCSRHNEAQQGLMSDNVTSAVKKVTYGGNGESPDTYIRPNDNVTSAVKKIAYDGHGESPVTYFFHNATNFMKDSVCDGSKGAPGMDSPAAEQRAERVAHRGFFGSRHFSQANAWLEARGKKPIDWQL